MRLSLSDTVDMRMADADHGWWFPEREQADPNLFGVFESNANILCLDGAEFCSPEIGSWPHTALLCRVIKRNHEPDQGKGEGAHVRRFLRFARRAIR